MEGWVLGLTTGRKASALGVQLWLVAQLLATRFVSVSEFRRQMAGTSVFRAEGYT